MSYIEQSLSKNEEIYKIFSIHWFAYLGIITAVLLAPFTLGLTLIIAIWIYVGNKCTEQGVTNKKVVLKKGIISRVTSEMTLGAIETIVVDQGILGRILGYGNIKVTGRGNSEVLFKYIDDPLHVKRSIENLLDEN